MTPTERTTAITNVILDEAPALIELLTSAFGRKHPDQPALTSAEAIASYEDAFASVKLTATHWLAAHPEKP